MKENHDTATALQVRLLVAEETPQRRSKTAEAGETLRRRFKTAGGRGDTATALQDCLGRGDTATARQDCWWLKRLCDDAPRLLVAGETLRRRSKTAGGRRDTATAFQDC
jgi:hypothetical protein